ncbi:hypothetical protein G7Z17_g2757 [Cylindrodendrum hubeiense]|uniref:DUF1665 domain-containing protein n=1 Tax=Cylindrodendrum hubeiense TaxID=595255 RepID=A0A9P5HK59_9HYPO|nr:hypothetical protein G7Z17_g2757 [Cylindrodendrum hubeiense]
MSTESLNPGGGSILLPGYGLPLDNRTRDSFPVLVAAYSEWAAATLLLREICMLKVIEDITNKPDWWIKVSDEEIVAKWRNEAIAMPWTDYHEYADFTEKMADACIKELRKKANIYVKTGLIPVMDYSACALKSDCLIPDDLREALKSAVAPLENVPVDRKDWHPGSDDRVLDLVHPSLWPLLYGRSRILPDKRINLQNCLEYCGTGLTLPKLPKPPAVDTLWNPFPVETLSSRFQWLPCDVDLTGDHPRIDSYINNLHPVRHALLYPVIEKFIEKALPAWDIVYRWPKEFQVQRLFTNRVSIRCSVPEICSKWDTRTCYESSRPPNENEVLMDLDDDGYPDSEQERLDYQWFKETHPMNLPDPKPDLNDLVKFDEKDVKTSGFFAGASRIQVIVKLANIHLTPDKPHYDGGSWHIEGQLNEHICSTALYYYDCDNITDCRLDFRTQADEEKLRSNLSYDQGDHDSIYATFGIRNDTNQLQDIGGVLTRPNRMLFFPNIYQHRVSSFELADKTKPGHRKILALFLVDPTVPVISTANVPPQQHDWWAESAFPADFRSKLPSEIMDMVVDDMDFPIGEIEAKEIRKELMAERTVLNEQSDTNLEKLQWSFCEH